MSKTRTPVAAQTELLYRDRDGKLYYLHGGSSKHSLELFVSEGESEELAWVKIRRAECVDGRPGEPRYWHIITKQGDLRASSQPSWSNPGFKPLNRLSLEGYEITKNDKLVIISERA